MNDDRLDEEVRALLAAPVESPFSDAEHAAMRRAVLAEIERRGPAYSFWPLLLRAAAAGLAVAVLGFLLSRWTARPQPPKPPVARRYQPVPAPTTAPAAPLPQPEIASLPEPTTPLTTFRRAAAGRTPRRLRPPERGGAPGTPIRIEIQTANPAIRIIWVVNAAPTFEPSLSEGS